MQQINNILLASSAKNSAGSSKALTQDANSEDFSAALASVTSMSSPSTKATVVQESSAKSAKVETSADETNGDDDADINLIFAQIGMANEMKKAAATGEALPLAADIAATEDADSASSSVLADELSQTEDPTVVGTFSDELAQFASSNTTSLSNTKLDAGAESGETEPLAQTQAGQSAAKIVTLLSQQQASQQKAADESVEQQLPADVDAQIVAAAAVEDSDTQGASVDDSLTIDDASLLTGLRTEKFVKPPENNILPIEGESILGAKELGTKEFGTKEMELSGKTINLSTHAVDKAIAPQTMTFQAVDNQASINTTTAANTKDLNTLGTNTLGAVTIDPSLATDNPSRSEISAGLLLKDAKLAVTLDAQQDSRISSFSYGSEEAGSEFKPVDFKPVSSSVHSLAAQAMHRPDTPQIQLSLRQGVETQNQMQEMIQRFSPVMKQQLVTMVSQGIQQAEIRLDPPELGHMLVKVQVHGDQTQVQFHVTQSQTRDVVEQAIPRLRELLQEQGLQLADSHVSQGDQGQRREGEFGEAGGSSGVNVDDFSAEELDLGLNQATSLNSGIDYYA
ncbi:flagellar hook-length control protein FliK [Shewanella sp.]|uniref:flagellar hook-length control protein FliK n=1 Tax=Shewanella sp. TaxID=50422 RepID=UPI003A87E910